MAPSVDDINSYHFKAICIRNIIHKTNQNGLLKLHMKMIGSAAPVRGAPRKAMQIQAI